MAQISFHPATKERQQAAKAVVDDTNARVRALQPAVAANGAATASIAAHLEAMERIMAANRLATVTVRLNPSGSTYELPSDEASRADLLNGAKIVLREQGVGAPYEAAITSLENFSVTFQLFVTDAAQALYSTVGVVLGRSATAAYAGVATRFQLKNGDALMIDLTTSAATGDVVEVCRVQPWSDNPASDTDPYRKAGVSFLGTRITTNGVTTFHLGHYAQDGHTWVDESLTKVVTWKCPDASSEPEEVIVGGDDGVDRTNWVDLEDRLAALHGAKDVSVVCHGATADHPAMPFVRFPKLYTKREKTTLNLPIDDGTGNLVENLVPCMVTWFCDTAADAAYRPMDAYLQPVRQSDDSIAEVERDFCYISAYPVSNVQNLAVVQENGTTVSMSCARIKAGEGREYVPGHRGISLERVKPLNWTTITISADGEEDVVLQPNYENRTVIPMGSRHIGFLQQLGYLHFGVNVQGAASATNPENNIFPGICTFAVAGTTNGATDYIRALGKRTGAADPRAITNSILFCGIEDGLWSSTGCYNENITFVVRRSITTGADGAVLSNVTSAQFLYCEDSADLKPVADTAAINNTDTIPEITTEEADSFEGRLKLLHHYKAMPSTVNTASSLYRAHDADEPGLRDLCYPTDDPAEANINMGACDALWKPSYPNYITAFSASTAYAAGSYVLNGNVLYRFTEAHAAGVWTGEDAEVVANSTVVQRKYELVALGSYRTYGSSLGLWTLSALYNLASSYGNHWRLRLALY